MQEQQIHIIGAQAGQHLVNCGFFGIHGGPELGYQEDFFPGDTAVFDAASSGALIHIGIRRIDQAHAAAQCAFHRSLGFSGRKREYTNTGHRHPGSVIQIEVFHGMISFHARRLAFRQAGFALRVHYKRSSLEKPLLFSYNGIRDSYTMERSSEHD